MGPSSELSERFVTPSPEVSGRSLSPSPEVSGSSVGPSPEVSGTPEVSGRSANPSSEVSEKGFLGVIQMQIALLSSSLQCLIISMLMIPTPAAEAKLYRSIVSPNYTY